MCDPSVIIKFKRIYCNFFSNYSFALLLVKNVFYQVFTFKVIISFFKYFKCNRILRGDFLNLFLCHGRSTKYALFLLGMEFTKYFNLALS